mgnify:CR=1 FL=1
MCNPDHPPDDETVLVPNDDVFGCEDLLYLVSSHLCLTDLKSFSSTSADARKILFEPSVKARYELAYTRCSSLAMRLRFFFTPTLFHNTGGVVREALTVLLRNKILSVSDVLFLEEIALLPPNDTRRDVLVIVLARLEGQKLTLGSILKHLYHPDHPLRAFCMGNAHMLCIYLLPPSFPRFLGGVGTPANVSILAILPNCREGGFLLWEYARSMGAVGQFCDGLLLVNAISHSHPPLLLPLPPASTMYVHQA